MGAASWLGVDLGGTNCRLAVIDQAGLVRARRVMSTRGWEGPDAVLGRMGQAAGDMIAQAGGERLTVGGIGVACAGVIDHQRGVVAYAPNLPGWHEIALVKRLSVATGLPVVLGNDADLYAWGEYRFGAGRAVKDLMCFTLGTGVGGGLIIDGRLISGPLGTGGEVGHLIVEPQGRICGCGAQGCVEAYGSATGLGGMLSEALESGRSSRLRPDDDPKAMAAAAREGDELAVELFAKAGRALGRAMVGVAVITGVGQMIVGGGVAAAWGLMEPAAREEIAERLHMIDPGRLSIKQGELGNMAATMGAAALARETHATPS